MEPAIKRPGAVVLFPGQGAFYPGALSGVQSNSRVVAEMRATVDDVAREMLGHPVFDARMMDPANDVRSLVTEAPVELQLAIYGTSVATYRILAANGLEPRLLVGHSLGEIAALVCAGAWTLEQGAQIVAHRSLALAEHAGDGFGMAALGMGPEQADHLVALTGGDAVVAVENHARQTVVTGTAAALEKIGAVARGLEVSCVTLSAPFPFHSPWAARAAADFRRRLGAEFPAAPMTLPVHSPIEGREYTGEDDLADLVSRHLVRRLRFAPTISDLHDDGTVYVESGALGSLSGIVGAILGDRPHTAVPTLLSADRESASLSRALTGLRELGVLSGNPSEVAAVTTLHDALLPDVGQEAFAQFWSDHAAELSTTVRAMFGSWSPDHAAPQVGRASVAAAPAPAERVAADAPVPAAPAPAQSREEVLARVVELYATALEYPAEVLEENADLEAELGVDSVKRTELLARVSDTFGLPAQQDGFRPMDLTTIGHVVDLILHQRGPEQAVAPAVGPEQAVAPAPEADPREEVLARVVELYATALEYPAEVLEEDADLEAELGVDSVKRTELLARVSDTFGLPAPQDGFRPMDLTTIGHVVDLILHQRAGAGVQAVAPALGGVR
ncbi:acyltransferase domain-containing protein [Antribacter gilvus]|uniref:acyltransferase domain-containing protein n=1 Tax=Antribacter gilvus TaxID=2304675 RepID=UPI000F78E8A4|nr:acyltransferase domain-containing protein [Antribacter gilvus]